MNGLDSLERMTINIDISWDATQLFIQELVQANNKETINVLSLCSHSFGCKSRATRPFIQQTSPVNNKEDVIFHHSHRVIACYPSITVPNDDHCANC